MNPSTLLGKVIEVPDKPIKRPKSAIEYDRKQLFLDHKKRMKKLKAEQYKIRRPNE